MGMTMAASLSSLSASLAALRGTGSVPIYTDWSKIIALDSSDQANAADVAAFRARLAAVSVNYTYVPATTQAAIVAAFEALDPEDQAGPVMLDIEIPWLVILSSADADAVDGSWASMPAVVTEFARQGVTLSGATMATYKEVAQRLWSDSAAAVKALGATRVVHYASAGFSFLEGTNGVPRSGFRPSATSDATRSYWPADPVYYNQMELVASTHGTDGSVASLLIAQRNADAYGIGCYCLMPTGSLVDATIGSWTIDSNIARKLAGSTVTPPHNKADDLYWTKAMTRIACGQGRRSMQIASSAFPSCAAYVPNKVALIVFLSPAPGDGLVSNIIYANHWNGMFSLPSSERAAALMVAAFDDGDADSQMSRGPNEFWVWDYTPYYMRTLPFSNRSAATSSAQKAIDCLRCGFEKMFFGRAAKAVGEPIGGTDYAAHAVWFAANNLGDTFWKTGVSQKWWKTTGGDQTGLGFDPSSSLLAPYLDTGSDIGVDQIKRACCMYATEYLVSAIESARSGLDAIGR